MRKTTSAKLVALSILKKLAVLSAKKNANATCYWYDNQPALPEAVKKLREF